MSKSSMLPRSECRSSSPSSGTPSTSPTPFAVPSTTSSTPSAAPLTTSSAPLTSWPSTDIFSPFFQSFPNVFDPSDKAGVLRLLSAFDLVPDPELVQLEGKLYTRSGRNHAGWVVIVCIDAQLDHVFHMWQADRRDTGDVK